MLEKWIKNNYSKNDNAQNNERKNMMSYYNPNSIRMLEYKCGYKTQEVERGCNDEVNNI